MAARFAREGGYLRGKATCTVGGEDRESFGNGCAGEAKGVGQVLIGVQTAGKNRCLQWDAIFSHWFELDAFFIDRLACSAHGRAGDCVPELVVRALLCLSDSRFSAVGPRHHPGLLILGAGCRR